MRLADFKFIDRTQGALTWRIVERIQRLVEETQENQIRSFSSMIAHNQYNSISVDMNLRNREIIVNKT
ncbi:MAG TPA: hypothetical protein VMV49_15270 [Candidatus Deferrimicrobium sp.]|nr:hypothetical protein [Candidatus Deferrimicrobium sp.]